MRIFLWLSVLLLFQQVNAQSKYSIMIYDDLSGHPIENVYVYYRDTIACKTNQSGFFQLSASEGDSIFLIHRNYDAPCLILPVNTRFKVGIKSKTDNQRHETSLATFYEIVQKNLKYPGKLRYNGIVAKVFVEFKVDSLGDSHLIQVHNDPEYLFFPVIQEVFKQIPPIWNISYGGKTIILPIRFRLDGVKDYPVELPELEADEILEEIVVIGFGYKISRD